MFVFPSDLLKGMNHAKTLGVMLLLVLASSSASAEPSREPIEQRLAAHKGQVLVVNFWAAWCKPCRKELPLLMELQNQYRNRGVQFIGACTDADEDRHKAEGLLREKAIRYPVWFGLSDEEMKEIGLGSSIPATAIFDQTGRRSFRLIGEVKRKHLEERIEWLLGSRDHRPPKELMLPPGLDRTEYQEKRGN
ncbi:MAG: TlpA disulfide reductase family protein [Acidobacteriota bacterium]